jgi:hypothetical protein
MEYLGHNFYGCSGNVISCGIACEDLKRLLNGNTRVIWVLKGTLTAVATLKDLSGDFRRGFRYVLVSNTGQHRWQTQL